jgi:hypothetical protein
VLNPHNQRRLFSDCDKFDWPKEWPNSKGINAFTATAYAKRKPMPLEHFLEHKMAKLAGLDKTEVFSLFGLPFLSYLSAISRGIPGVGGFDLYVFGIAVGGSAAPVDWSCLLRHQCFIESNVAVNPFFPAR